MFIVKDLVSPPVVVLLGCLPWGLQERGLHPGSKGLGVCVVVVGELQGAASGGFVQSLLFLPKVLQNRPLLHLPQHLLHPLLSSYFCLP